MKLTIHISEPEQSKSLEPDDFLIKWAPTFANAHPIISEELLTSAAVTAARTSRLAFAFTIGTFTAAEFGVHIGILQWLSVSEKKS